MTFKESIHGGKEVSMTRRTVKKKDKVWDNKIQRFSNVTDKKDSP